VNGIDDRCSCCEIGLTPPGSTGHTAEDFDFVFVDGRVARLLSVESSPVVLERVA
jgi:hypothetical protein